METVEKFEAGEKVIIKTSRLGFVIKNDLVVIVGCMARGGYSIESLSGKYLGVVRKSDIKHY